MLRHRCIPKADLSKRGEHTGLSDQQYGEYTGILMSRYILPRKGTEAYFSLIRLDPDDVAQSSSCERL